MVAPRGHRSILWSDYLFVSRNAQLRRIVYVILVRSVPPLSSLSPIVSQRIRPAIWSSITPMPCVLVRIIAASMLSAIEWYIKQAIINKSYQVHSSALVSSVHVCELSVYRMLM